MAGSLHGAANNIRSCYSCLNSVDEHDSALSPKPVKSFASVSAGRYGAYLICFVSGQAVWVDIEKKRSA